MIEELDPAIDDIDPLELPRKPRHRALPRQQPRRDPKRLAKIHIRILRDLLYLSNEEVGNLLGGINASMVGRLLTGALPMTVSIQHMLRGPYRQAIMQDPGWFHRLRRMADAREIDDPLVVVLKARQAAGSLAKFAEIAMMSPMTVRDWLRGRHLPNPPAFYRIIRFLDREEERKNVAATKGYPQPSSSTEFHGEHGPNDQADGVAVRDETD
jgi:hypothetical protein